MYIHNTIHQLTQKKIEFCQKDTRTSPQTIMKKMMHKKVIHKRTKIFYEHIY